MPNVISFHYTLRDPEGRVLDTSLGGQALAYLEGAGQIIEGLEEALAGLPCGTKTSVQVPAAKGYGERDDGQVQRVPKSVLPVEGEINIGDQFQTGPEPSAPIVTVRSIEGDDVILDANHPLAGVDLTFDVEIVCTRPATPEEIEHPQRPINGGCCGGGGDDGSSRKHDGCDRPDCGCH
ncbi:FKBP-type peptidyl-prolyl cis-trans isomerase [Geminisphaera colitermitum]|uniref:FKBP-type peptidyl-prolyl cis-trans isomerase n=1 Tax=Geminisphaera colitermitum TaxID=1148786 RepID=UPI00019651FC|nr:peptidylprolyl isomerase [Geminisphaera colitermitum]